MASRQQTVDYLVGQMAGAGTITSRRMFGEFGLYCDGKIVALVCDDRLFVKPTAAGRAHIGEVREGEPYPGAKPYFEIPGEAWDDSDWLAELIRVSAAELPSPAPKRAKGSSPRRKSP